jgi:ferredoxin-type protein NapH
MTTETQSLDQARAQSPRMATWKALLLCLPIFLLSSLIPLMVLQSGNLLAFIASVPVWILLNVFFALMVFTGKTHRYRSVLFIMVAISLPLDFIPWMVETYGSMMLTDEIIYSGGASFCPLTMPMVIVPALTKGIVIFPGQLVGTGSHGIFSFMALLWLGASLSIGRGWCSWGCFYGGWDEFFSRLRKKPLIKHKQIDRRWTYLPFGILLAIVLLSAITFQPVYCEWLCPFKLVTEFQAPSSALAVIQIAIFVLLFIGLVIVLPLLTRRRIQCGLFCPFGAMQSFFNRITIFDIRIDLDKCSHCQKCIRECPTFALDASCLESGKPLMTCTRCAHCIDNCPTGAITYRIKGTSLKASPAVARVLYLYPAYFLMTFMGGSLIMNALHRILTLITTGSILYH